MHYVTSRYEAPSIQLEQREVLASPLTWWTVLIIVLLALAANLSVAVDLWCVTHGYAFAADWSVNWLNGTVAVGCF